MTGQVNLQRSKIKQGRSEVLLHFIHFFPLFFNGGDQRAAVYDRYFKTFHDRTKSDCIRIPDF